MANILQLPWGRMHMAHVMQIGAKTPTQDTVSSNINIQADAEAVWT